MQICSSDELLGKVHRESGKGNRHQGHSEDNQKDPCEMQRAAEPDLQSVDHFNLVLLPQSLNTVVEQRVDVVLDSLNLLPIHTLQLGLQVLEVHLNQRGRDRHKPGHEAV